MRGLQLVAGLLVALAAAGLVGCGGDAKPGKSLTQQYNDALKVSDAGLRARRLVSVADKQQKAGDLAGVGDALAAAKEAAMSVADPVSQANTLNLVAGAYARLDAGTDEVKLLLRESAQAIERIEHAGAKVLPLADLAAATSTHLKSPEAAAQHLKTAEEAAAKIELAPDRVRALGRIAAAYGKSQRDEDRQRVMTEARALADGQSDLRAKADCLAEIGAACHLLKDAAAAAAAFTAAEQAAAEVEDTQSQAYALLNIAQKVTATKQKAQAKKLLNSAQDVAAKVKDSSIRGPLMQDIDAALKQL